MTKNITSDLPPEQQNQKLLLEANIKALREGRELLDVLDPGLYNKAYLPAFIATIGEHFRHIIEHYHCLFEQLDSRVICYDWRRRNRRLEQDIDFAEENLAKIERDLLDFDYQYFNQHFQLQDQQSQERMETSLERELIFLQSHTVHHYAMIAAIARANGVQPKQDFGVAIATRAFHQELPETGVCAQ